MDLYDQFLQGRWIDVQKPNRRVTSQIQIRFFDEADPALIRSIYDELARYRVTSGLFESAGIDLTEHATQ